MIPQKKRLDTLNSTKKQTCFSYVMASLLRLRASMYLPVSRSLAEPGVLPAGAGGGQAGGLSLPEPGQLLCAGGPGLDRGGQGGGSYQDRSPYREMAQEAPDFNIQYPPGRHLRPTSSSIINIKVTR